MKPEISAIELTLSSMHWITREGLEGMEVISMVFQLIITYYVKQMT